MKIQDYLKSNNAKEITFISGQYEVRLTNSSSRHNLMYGSWNTLLNAIDEVDDIQSNEIYIKTNNKLKADNIKKIIFTYSGKIIIH